MILCESCRTCGEEVEDIIGFVEHDCDDVLTGPDLTKNEQSTLRYIEQRLVGHGGVLDRDRMNWEDFDNLKLFQALELLYVEDGQVEMFSDKAWRLARECRQMRAERGTSDDVDLGDIPEVDE